MVIKINNQEKLLKQDLFCKQIGLNLVISGKNRVISEKKTFQ